MRVEFHSEALDDARQARRWYEERSPAAAERFGAEPRHAQDLAAALPGVGSRPAHAGSASTASRTP